MGVEIMVGVHVELGRQGTSLPTVQGVTAGAGGELAYASIGSRRIRRFIVETLFSEREYL